MTTFYLKPKIAWVEVMIFNISFTIFQEGKREMRDRGDEREAEEPTLNRTIPVKLKADNYRDEGYVVPVQANSQVCLVSTCSSTNEGRKIRQSLHLPLPNNSTVTHAAKKRAHFSFPVTVQYTTGPSQFMFF
ncbi:hypothetical protein ACTXT7_015830 [Hymenolepis weldensis]